MPASAKNTPLVLIVRDGWGENPNPEHDKFNAVKLARTPVADQLKRDWPWTLIKTSGEDVGLPDGTMGNSEVGHQNIGAGRIVEQESRVITKAMEQGFHTISTIRTAIESAKARGAAVHLLGICSDAGVHGLLEHLYAFVRACKQLGQPRVFLHLFTDGRDTGPYSGLGFVKQVEGELARIGGIAQLAIASVAGRYYAMDRDNRWERVHRAYACLTGRDAAAQQVQTAPHAAAALQKYYDHPSGETLKGDEFIPPTMIGPDPKTIEASRIHDGDAVIFYNYRGDRPREITKSFVHDGFKDFDRGPKLDLYYATMTEYEAGLPVNVISPKPEALKNILGAVVSGAGIAQFRCAETEKNPHVTFFFNNYRATPFPGEDRGCPASPKVPTYDLQPEMSAAEVTRVAKEAILSGKYGLIVVNFANPDMVGHTGSLPAAIKAVEATDRGVGELLEALATMGGRAVIGADHGNAEQMWDPVTNMPHTSHTLNPVEFFVVGDDFAAGRTKLRSGGRLADIAPTVLALMGLPKPAEMTGESLIAG
jgi:2,3-bisphosphoglycerate-independent phosphoglycerate mutase